MNRLGPADDRKARRRAAGFNTALEPTGTTSSVFGWSMTTSHFAASKRWCRLLAVKG